jgi:uncharacterized protein involved in oxidation of intracellular sulfur
VKVLVRREEAVGVLLTGDAVTCAVDGQKVPDGCHHLDGMIDGIARDGGEIGSSTSCVDARAITDDVLTTGARGARLTRSRTETQSADKVLIF